LNLSNTRGCHIQPRDGSGPLSQNSCEFLGGNISSNLGRLIVALASCGILCAGQAFCQPNQTCKLQDLNGTYGFTLKGDNLARGVSYIVAGVLTSDGSGNITGSGKQTVGGQVSDAQFTGTYQLNADCSGTTHLQFVGGVQSDLYFVLVQDGEEAMMLYTGPGVLESGNAKRVHTAKGKP
jgi:hypothetical protein